MTHALTTAYANEEGYEAAIDGTSDSNPYRDGSPMSDAWQAGYEQGSRVREEWEESNHERAKRYA